MCRKVRDIWSNLQEGHENPDKHVQILEANEVRPLLLQGVHQQTCKARCRDCGSLSREDLTQGIWRLLNCGVLWIYSRHVVSSLSRCKLLNAPVRGVKATYRFTFLTPDLEVLSSLIRIIHSSQGLLKGPKEGITEGILSPFLGAARFLPH